MTYNILIVDNSTTIRRVLKRVLGMIGLDVELVREASNGREALESLQSQRTDVVFCDLNMPEMTGMELVDIMAADTTLVSIPVIIVSSDRSASRKEQMLSSGARAYITKPFRPETVRDVLDTVLKPS